MWRLVARYVPLGPLHNVEKASIPKIFPPLPLRYYQFYPIKITSKTIFNRLVNQNEELFNNYLRTSFNQSGIELNEEIKEAIKLSFQKILIEHEKLEFYEEDKESLVEMENKIIAGFQVPLRVSLNNLKYIFEQTIGAVYISHRQPHYSTC